MIDADTTRSGRRLRPGGITGLASIALALIGNTIRPIWTFPETGASPHTVVDFVSDHSAALKAMMLIYAVTVALWLVFAADVAGCLRAKLPAESMLAPAFSAGLVGMVTLLLAGFTCFDVAIYQHVDAAGTKLLYDLAFGLLAMSGMPTAVGLAAFAVSVYRYRIFARSCGLVAAIAAAAHVLLILSFVFGSGPFSLESAAVITGIPVLLFAWIGQTSSTLKVLASDDVNRVTSSLPMR